jgi:uncharacterized damage-inducible protein DinB
MSTIDTAIQVFQFNRTRTLLLLDQVEETPASLEALGWRPGEGRAHIAWQLMHIAITEEVFATERLMPDKPASFTELWPRFRGGSTPDDDIPAVELIRHVLADGREHLLDTLSQFSDEQLDSFEVTIRDRTLTLRTALNIIGWHEAHHHGQAHITLNLYKATQAG